MASNLSDNATTLHSQPSITLLPTATTFRYIYTDYWEEFSDPRNKGYPLMYGPWGLAAILLTYLVFVRKLGPQLMKNRGPFGLRKTLIAYNAAMVVINVYFFRYE